MLNTVNISVPEREVLDLTGNSRFSSFFILNVAAIVPIFYCSSVFGAAEFDCVIEPRQIVELRPPVAGVIDKIDVDRGDLISKGQVLAVLQSGVETASLDLAKYRAFMEGAIKSQEAKLLFAQRRADRDETLVNKNFISAQERDDALAQVRVAEADLQVERDNRHIDELNYQIAAEQLKLRTIKSPFSGVVMDRLMNPGDLTDLSDSRKPVLRIAEISVLRVEAILPSAAYKLVKLGGTADVTPEIGTGILSAKVKAVDKVMDAASGTFGVRLEFVNEGYRVPAGIKCKVKFQEMPDSLSRFGRSGELLALPSLTTHSGATPGGRSDLRSGTSPRK